MKASCFYLPNSCQYCWILPAGKRQAHLTGSHSDGNITEHLTLRPTSDYSDDMLPDTIRQHRPASFPYQFELRVNHSNGLATAIPLMGCTMHEVERSYSIHSLFGGRDE